MKIMRKILLINPNQTLLKNKLIDLDNNKNSYNNNNFDKNDKNSFYQKIALKFKENLNTYSNENYSNNTININDMNSSNKKSITLENDKKSSKILKNR